MMHIKCTKSDTHDPMVLDNRADYYRVTLNRKHSFEEHPVCNIKSCLGWFHAFIVLLGNIQYKSNLPSPIIVTYLLIKA